MYQDKSKSNLHSAYVLIIIFYLWQRPFVWQEAQTVQVKAGKKGQRFHKQQGGALQNDRKTDVSQSHSFGYKPQSAAPSLLQADVLGELVLSEYFK